MRRYLRIAKNTWDETFTYRFSFLTYRIRNILQILTIYYLWTFFIPQNTTFLGYSQSQMLTYVLGTMIVSSVVMATRSQAIGNDINQGNLSSFLLKPMNYFGYWFARDLGDKTVNFFFSITELVLLFILLHPPFFLQTDPFFLIMAILSICFGTLLYFYFSVLMGCFGFWSNEVWGPRFVFYQIIMFFSGSLFPLDILPKTLYSVLELLPFNYLIYFPLKIYLGDLSAIAIVKGLIITTVWIGIVHYLTTIVWQKGLKVYTAYGR